MNGQSGKYNIFWIVADPFSPAHRTRFRAHDSRFQVAPIFHFEIAFEFQACQIRDNTSIGGHNYRSQTNDTNPIRSLTQVVISAFWIVKWVMFWLYVYGFPILGDDEIFIHQPGQWGNDLSGYVNCFEGRCRPKLCYIISTWGVPPGMM